MLLVLSLSSLVKFMIFQRPCFSSIIVLFVYAWDMIKASDSSSDSSVSSSGSGDVADCDCADHDGGMVLLVRHFSCWIHNTNWTFCFWIEKTKILRYFVELMLMWILKLIRFEVPHLQGRQKDFLCNTNSKSIPRYTQNSYSVEISENENMEQ